jgi:hypothetical protein
MEKTQQTVFKKIGALVPVQWVSDSSPKKMGERRPIGINRGKWKENINP